MYKDQTYASTSQLKRFIHQKRLKDALKILDLKNSDHFLDYGCGDAQLLLRASEILPSQNLFGYEPAKIMFEEAVLNLKNSRIKLTSSLEDLKEQKFEKIGCFETLEHLTSQKIKEALENISQLASDEGKIIISVPLEIGLAALLKNSFRLLFNREHNLLNFHRYFRAIFGLQAPREPEKKLSDIDYIYSHLGFDHRELEKKLKQYFKIENKIYSPLNFLGPIINNTIYYICSKK